MRIWILLTVFWGLSLPLQSIAQTDFCNARNVAYQEGEQLYFKVWYNLGVMWIGAGEANFSVSSDLLNGKKMYHIVGEGKTLSSYDMFYKVRDRYESWVDATTMQPAKFLRNVNEGGYRIYNNVLFNQNIGRAISTNGVYQVPKCVQDVVSAIYFARNIDFNTYRAGDKIPFSMFLDDQVYHLYLRYLGKQKIKTRYGVFNTIKIAPLLIQGNSFSGGEQMLVYVTDDENHLPVRIESPISVGSIKADLMGYRALRNPLSSLLKKG